MSPSAAKREVDLLAPPDQGAVSSALRSYAAALHARYGARLRGIYLFGSRARGDFNAYSDADIAIVVEDSVRPSAQTKPLTALAYDVFLETGTEVQPWVFQETEWNDPRRSGSSNLVRAARRDGRSLWQP
jgi:antitoxin ChpS